MGHQKKFRYKFFTKIKENKDFFRFYTQIIIPKKGFFNAYTNKFVYHVKMVPTHISIRVIMVVFEVIQTRLGFGICVNTIMVYQYRTSL